MGSPGRGEPRPGPLLPSALPVPVAERGTSLSGVVASLHHGWTACPALNGTCFLPGLVPAWRTGQAPRGAAPPPRGAGPRLSRGARRPSGSRPQEPGSPRPPEGPGHSPALEAESMEPGDRPAVPSHWLGPSRPLSGLSHLPVTWAFKKAGFSVTRVRQGRQVRRRLSPTRWSPPVPETGNRRGTGGASQGHVGTPGSVREPGTPGPLLRAPREDAGEAGQQAQGWLIRTVSVGFGAPSLVVWGLPWVIRAEDSVLRVGARGGGTGRAPLGTCRGDGDGGAG